MSEVLWLYNTQSMSLWLLINSGEAQEGVVDPTRKGIKVHY